jgi:hypothetical protein
MNVQLPGKSSWEPYKGDEILNQQDGILLEEVAGLAERGRDGFSLLVTAAIS